MNVVRAEDLGQGGARLFVIDDAGAEVHLSGEGAFAEPYQSLIDAWIADGGVVAPASVTQRALPPISDRQFAQGLATRGITTKAEALAFVQTGAIPSAMQAIIDGIADEDERFEAELLISGATSFQREHPLTEAIGAAYGWDSAEIDEFWAECAAL